MACPEEEEEELEEYDRHGSPGAWTEVYDDSSPLGEQRNPVRGFSPLLPVPTEQPRPVRPAHQRSPSPSQSSRSPPPPPAAPASAAASSSSAAAASAAGEAAPPYAAPTDLCCPISLAMFVDPVHAPSIK